jgi:uncharacterized protein (TIGR02466 family)
MSPAPPLQSRALFATRVYAFDLEPERAKALNQELWAEIDRLLTPRPAAQPWQTRHDLQRNAAFAPLLELVHAAARQVAQDLRLAVPAFRVTGCWANVNMPGFAHNAHNHPNNLFSGVYYLATDKGADVITFLDPRPQVLQVLPRFETATTDNMTDITLPTPVGRLLLFPGWLVHGVPTNRSNRERVSISFNLMPEDWGG